MIIKYCKWDEDSRNCVWSIVSGAKEIDYGYSKAPESMTKEEVEKRNNCRLQPPSYISFFKMYKNEGGEANLIFLSERDEAFLMTDDGKTIERLR